MHCQNCSLHHCCAAVLHAMLYSAMDVQECGTSGHLWAELIAAAPRPARKQKGAEALKRCNDDPHVVAAIAQLFQAGHPELGAQHTMQSTCASYAANQR